MKKIFTVKVKFDTMANFDTKETLVSLPLSYYELMDIEHRYGGLNLMQVCSIAGFRDFTELSAFLSDKNVSFCFLNCLALKLVELTDFQRFCFQKMIEEKKEHCNEVGNLIEMAYHAGCYQAISVTDDASLGRYYVNNHCQLANMPDELLKYLDFEKIGQEVREKKGGMYSEFGYLMEIKTFDPECIPLLPDSPKYVFRLGFCSQTDKQQRVTFDFPYQSPADIRGLNGMVLESVDGIISNLEFSNPFTFETFEKLNDLSHWILHNVPALSLWRACLYAQDSIHCTLDNAISATRFLNQYTLTNSGLMIEDVAKQKLSQLMDSTSLSSILPYINLSAYGVDLMEKNECMVTPYGVLWKNK